jgi:hypothetical protein
VRLACLCILLLAGCATAVIPPAHPTDPLTVYLTDYGRHSSVLLPTGSGQYVEYAYGDWEFFARGDTKWWVALRAVLDSPKATLGRRFVTSVKRESLPGCDRLMEFHASRPRVEALVENLDYRFRRGSATPLHSTYSGLDHVPDSVHYWALHNCNHETADWLIALGCEIRGSAIWSDFFLRLDSARPGATVRAK